MSDSRSDCLGLGALGGGAVVLRVPVLEAEGSAGTNAGQPPFAPNKWISIDRRGTVTLVTARSEMGQGARTSLAMILAEELEAAWSKVAVLHAKPGTMYPGMRTSSSSERARLTGCRSARQVLPRADVAQEGSRDVRVPVAGVAPKGLRLTRRLGTPRLVRGARRPGEATLPFRRILR